MKEAEPVQKITIVPRTMGSLGYVMQVPEEEKYLNTKDELLTRITTLFGGRAAEQIVFKSITTGASNDIEQATKIARAMVTQFGMSDRFGLMGLESVENRYLDGRAVLNCGDATAAEIDNEVMRILKECYDKALNLLEGDRETLDKIAEFLLEKETITGKEFMKIYREVKGIPESEDDKSVGDKSSDNKALEIIEVEVSDDKDDTKTEDTKEQEDIIKIAEVPKEDIRTDDKPQVEDEFNATKDKELR